MLPTSRIFLDYFFTVKTSGYSQELSGIDPVSSLLTCPGWNQHVLPRVSGSAMGHILRGIPGTFMKFLFLWKREQFSWSFDFHQYNTRGLSVHFRNYFSLHLCGNDVCFILLAYRGLSDFQVLSISYFKNEQFRTTIYTVSIKFILVLLNDGMSFLLRMPKSLKNCLQNYCQMSHDKIRMSCII